jgi:hypothetical protein
MHAPTQVPWRRRDRRAPLRGILTITMAILAMAALLSLGSAAALADVPGTAPSSRSQTISQADPSEALSPFATFSGEHLALSVDALGTNDPEGGPIEVEKKDAGETVRAAYLFAATTGEEGYEPQNGDVTLNGESIDWEAAHTISSDIDSFNAVDNVTSIVKPVVDGAPAGMVSLTVAENEQTLLYDGEILAVVMEDPAVKEPRSVTLLYGAQNPPNRSKRQSLALPSTSGSGSPSAIRPWANHSSSATSKPTAKRSRRWPADRTTASTRTRRAPNSPAVKMEC